jgi:hypothetical protein
MEKLSLYFGPAAYSEKLIVDIFAELSGSSSGGVTASNQMAL